MKKGISPIVAVVLLIAIAVIAAVGLYFWVGGLATEQPTPYKPIVINTQRVRCNTSSGDIILMLQNLDVSTELQADFGVIVDNGTCWSYNVTIPKNAQVPVTFSCNNSDDSRGYYHTLGESYSVYSNATTPPIGHAQFVC